MPIIKYHQTEFDLKGNCQSAVFATLFQIPLQTIPNFYDGIDLYHDNVDAKFTENMNNWLSTLGYSSITLVLSDPSFLRICKGLVQVIGKSPRGYNHVVIYKDGELWHDPHPEGGGVIPEYISFVVKEFELG